VSIFPCASNFTRGETRPPHPPLTDFSINAKRRHRKHKMLAHVTCPGTAQLLRMYHQACTLSPCECGVHWSSGWPEIKELPSLICIRRAQLPEPPCCACHSSNSLCSAPPQAGPSHASPAPATPSAWACTESAWPCAIKVAALLTSATHPRFTPSCSCRDKVAEAQAPRGVAW
jgi:hypothetical protein